ncbi:hypothetical protein [Belnapia rosea]|uniref:hypothetical protein n=1 Tax=Belnapia rosea TaxID=938405 RepID=UPI00088335A8|nr:hypothetical protein [Belnapia rosea]SDB71510.1 hypothetical protein SAMN02927895_04116 [Belnapia rosea]
MQWFITFTNRVGGLVFAWLGPMCLIAGMAAIAGGAYALWQSANPRSPWFARKWAPACVMMFGFMLVGLTNLLNLTGATLGTTGSYGVGMSSYEQVNIGAWANMTPAQAFVAVLGSFWLFWAATGAAICFRGVMAAIGVAKGTRRHGWGVPVVLFVSGSLVARIDQVAASLVNLLPTGS